MFKSHLQTIADGAGAVPPAAHGQRWTRSRLINTGLGIWLCALIGCLAAVGICAAWPKAYRAICMVEPGDTAGDRQRAIQSVLAGPDARFLSCREVAGTSLLEIVGRSADPRQAAAVANTAAERVRADLPNHFKIWSRAEVPTEPVRPNRNVVLGITFLASVPLLLFPGLAFVLIGLFRREHSEQAKRGTQFLVTGIVLAAALLLYLVFSNSAPVERQAPYVTAGPHFASGPVGPSASSPSAASADQLAQEGWQLWQTRQLPAAIAKFEAALKLAPGNANVWNGMGWASFNSGRIPEAERAFRQVVALEPNHPAARNGLGQIYLSQRKYEQAETELLRAGLRAPAAWYGLTRLYLLQGRFAEAEKYAQRIADTGQADAVVTKMLEAARARTLSDGLRAMIEPPPAPSPAPAASPSANEAKTTPSIDTMAVNQPPQLRALAWQDQEKLPNPTAWLPSGGLVISREGFPAFSGVDVSATRVAEEDPRFLCLWFSHPLFDAQSAAVVTLLDTDGKNALRTPDSSIAIGYTPAAPESSGTGWITATVCAGKKGQSPAAAMVRLRYSAGLWTKQKEVEADFKGGMVLDTGVLLGAQGQDAEGHAFVQIVRGSAEATSDVQVDFVALTKSGRRLERSGFHESGSAQVFTMRFTFDMPLVEVKTFECRERPVRLFESKVVLHP